MTSKIGWFWIILVLVGLGLGCGKQACITQERVAEAEEVVKRAEQIKKAEAEELKKADHERISNYLKKFGSSVEHFEAKVNDVGLIAVVVRGKEERVSPKEEAESFKKATALKSRVDEYLACLIKRDFKSSYQYETPDYRETTKFENYVYNFGPSVKWLEARVKRVEIDGVEGKAHFTVRYIWVAPRMGELPKKGFVSETVQEWEYIDSNWYHNRRTSRNLHKGGEGQVK